MIYTIFLTIHTKSYYNENILDTPQKLDSYINPQKPFRKIFYLTLGLAFLNLIFNILIIVNEVKKYKNKKAKEIQKLNHNPKLVKKLKNQKYNSIKYYNTQIPVILLNRIKLFKILYKSQVYKLSKINFPS